MSEDLEARVVQAARKMVAERVGVDMPTAVENILAGIHDDHPMIQNAILGARAALAEIERDGVVVPTARRPTETE